ncbi:AAA family ATPase [Ruminococcus flavefaciens]|uniref:AAA family ATPase n=1 Tax=Ruminococcus flavefaciens TaxID=1265 RepID=UPI003D70001A
MYRAESYVQVRLLQQRVHCDNTVEKKQEYFIYKMMHPELYILAGAPKIGKSWLALDVCLSVTSKRRK